MPVLPDLNRARLGAVAREHLESVVAIDSASDETSTTVPSTEGQRVLSEHLRGFFEGLGATVELDEFANVIASLPGRGATADLPPLALMIHLDTARGTAVPESLNVVPAWDGAAILYPDNPELTVDVAGYPTTSLFLGHDLLIGDGVSPFGLDDKLGLTHMMTLARILFDHPEIPHRPLMLIGRPDEEIGREDALYGLAATLAERGVTSAYTVDGLDPFEVNTANFNALGGYVVFASEPAEAPDGLLRSYGIGGVNTHGATAKAEGHRGAVRLAAEIAGRLDDGSRPLRFESNAQRDCDGVLALWHADADAAERARSVIDSVMAPHLSKGASLGVEEVDSVLADGAVGAMLAFVRDFLASAGPEPRLCEDSEGWEGYTQPYRVRWCEDGLHLDFRVRDFDPDGLLARREHVRVLAGARPSEWSHQYKNMGPLLAQRPDLAEAAMAAGAAIGVAPLDNPIRGGTGVDPFLDAGVFVANLGTGYFAPESEKEFTSLQLMADHALWLTALVQS
ncbi:MAG: peptidase T [Proteobacteria bacterium]|nr:peptidase T [Pseudomonadota bacterium]